MEGRGCIILFTEEGKPKGTRREVSMPLDYRYPLYPRGHVTEVVRVHITTHRASMKESEEKEGRRVQP